MLSPRLYRDCIDAVDELPDVREVQIAGPHGHQAVGNAVRAFERPHFAELDRSRIVYVGDSVTMDIGAARDAGLLAVLIDPHDDHAGADFPRISSLWDLLV